MNSNEFTLAYLLGKKRTTLQFFLIKYLKYDDIVKFSLVSKDAGHLFDAKKSHSNKSDLKDI